MTASRPPSARAASSRSRSSPSPVQDDPSTTRRSAAASISRVAGRCSGGSSGHQIVTGRSWMSSGRHDRRDVAAGLAAGGHVDHLGARLGRAFARQDAVRLDPRVQPRRAVGIRRPDDHRPRWMASGEGLDGRGAVLGELRPTGDDDEVHDARASCDIPARLAVHLGGQVRRGPDPGEFVLDLGDAVGPRGPAQDRLPDLERRRDGHRSEP